MKSYNVEESDEEDIGIQLTFIKFSFKKKRKNFTAGIQFFDRHKTKFFYQNYKVKKRIVSLPR